MFQLAQLDSCLTNVTLEACLSSCSEMKLSAVDRDSQFRGSLSSVYPWRGRCISWPSWPKHCIWYSLHEVFLRTVNKPWISALQLAGIYKNVVGTDTSAEQLSFAEKLPNIRYQQTTPAMTIDELKANVAPHQAVDLVTSAQAFHWFDRPTFYQRVKWLLKRPNGVLAVWCGALPRINDSIDAAMDRVYAELDPFWAPPRKMVDDEYRSFEFPFEPVEGTEHTGPFEFEGKLSMDLDACLALIRSWSAYQIARQKGFELLTEEVVEDFKRAWGGEAEKHNIKVAKFPIFLRIGKVGNE